MGTCAACLGKQEATSLEEERRGHAVQPRQAKPLLTSKEAKKQRELLALKAAMAEQERNKEIFEGQKKAPTRPPIQPVNPLIFEQIEHIQEMERRTIRESQKQKQSQKRKASNVSAGMEDDAEGIPQFDETENSSPRKVRQGVILENVDVNLEQAAEKARTGTLRPIQTPKGMAGFQMQLPGSERQRTGTTMRRGGAAEGEAEVDGETEMERGLDGQASGFEDDDAETEMERNVDAGSLMSGSDATSFQRVDQNSMRSGMSGATSIHRMGDGASTMTREVSDWESDGTYMKREEDAS